VSFLGSMRGRVEEDVDGTSEDALAHFRCTNGCDEGVDGVSQTGSHRVKNTADPVTIAFEDQGRAACPQVILVVIAAHAKYRCNLLELVQARSLSHVAEGHDKVCVLETGKQRRRELRPTLVDVAVGYNRDVCTLEGEVPGGL
jgi:hypothetical protein